MNDATVRARLLGWWSGLTGNFTMQYSTTLRAILIQVLDDAARQGRLDFSVDARAELVVVDSGE